jgi:hypothetical protein
MWLVRTEIAGLEVKNVFSKGWALAEHFLGFFGFLFCVLGKNIALAS